MSSFMGKYLENKIEFKKYTLFNISLFVSLELLEDIFGLNSDGTLNISNDI